MTQTAPTPGPGDYTPEAVADAPNRITLRTHGGVGTHATEMLLSAIAVVLAATGAILLAWNGAHVVGGWISLAGIIVGLYAQLTSDTTAERMVNVVAIGVSAVSFAFHLRHGGLY